MLTPRLAPLSVKSAEAWQHESKEDESNPLTPEEAKQWRARQPVLSIWRLVGIQFLVGLAACGLSWLLTQREPLAWSVLYGSTAVVIPSALMAYGPMKSCRDSR